VVICKQRLEEILNSLRKGSQLNKSGLKSSMLSMHSRNELKSSMISMRSNMKKSFFKGVAQDEPDVQVYMVGGNPFVETYQLSTGEEDEPHFGGGRSDALGLQTRKAAKTIEKKEKKKGFWGNSKKDDSKSVLVNSKGGGPTGKGTIAEAKKSAGDLRNTRSV